MKQGRAAAPGCGALNPDNRQFYPLKFLPVFLVPMLIFAGKAPLRAQAPAASAQIAKPGTATEGGAQPQTKPVREPSARAKRAAIKLFVRAAKLYTASRFEEAVSLDEKAAELDPTNPNYKAAAELARSHAVTRYVQQAATSREHGDEGAARTALARALELDPKSAIVAQHVDELAGDATRGMDKPLYVDDANHIGPPVELLPNKELHSFHQFRNMRQLIVDVFRAYGVEAILDDSLRAQSAHFDVDNVDFLTAAKLLELATGSFYAPIDAHKVIVARDTASLRQQYERMELETIYLPGLTEKDRTDVQNVAKNIFNFRNATLDASSGTLTLRALPETLNAFNATVEQMLDGKSQVVLEVKMYQLNYTEGRNTGAQLPQQMSVFDLAIEEQSLLSQNAALVQQIISSGLASANDPLAILALLLASGQVSNPLLQQFLSGGAGIIGGGASTTGLSPMSATFNLEINTSDSRELDDVQLRLGSDEKGTIKSGLKYPITTSTLSSSVGTSATIPGLNLPGLSGGLSSLLSNALASVPSIPMIQYEDVGLNLTATPEVMRNEDVALTLDLKLTSLSGQSVNNIPIMNNRSYSGVVTLKQGHAAVLVSDLDKEETRTLSGQPGLTDIPGLNNITNVNNALTDSRLVIVLTPHLVRGTQAGGHSMMMRVERQRAGAQ